MTQPKPNGPLTDDELLQEGSLWELYLTYRNGQNVRGFNLYFTLLVSPILALSAFSYAGSEQDLKTSLDWLLGIEMQVCSSILGFLIAGYTIFLSLLKPETSAMIQKTVKLNSNPPISIFKDLNLVFINTFIQYLLFIVGSTIIIAVVSAGCPGAHLFNLFGFGFIQGESCRVHLFKYFYFLSLLWSMILGLYLKSFVFNIFSSAMLVFQIDKMLYLQAKQTDTVSVKETQP